MFVCEAHTSHHPCVKPKLLFLLLLGAAAYVIILITSIKAEERSKAIQAKLESDFKALPSFPRATRVEGGPSHKLGHALVGATYATGATFPEIRAYYESVLLERGWHLAHEESLPRIIYYKKDRFTASLEYAGPRAQVGWNYAFHLSWGLH